MLWRRRKKCRTDPRLTTKKDGSYFDYRLKDCEGLGELVDGRIFGSPVDGESYVRRRLLSSLQRTQTATGNILSGEEKIAERGRMIVEEKVVTVWGLHENEGTPTLCSYPDWLEERMKQHKQWAIREQKRLRIEVMQMARLGGV